MVTSGPTPSPDNTGAQGMSPTDVPKDVPPPVSGHFSWANFISSIIGGYLIAGDVVNLALQDCHSRSNLAARLVAQMYTLCERAGSNCHGKQGKTVLDGERLKACMHYFPLQHLETQIMADTEMRNAVDEVCRKTKTAGKDENSL